MKKIRKVLSITLVIFLMFGFLASAAQTPSLQVQGSLEDDLKDIEEKIKAIQDKKDGLADQLAANESVLGGYSAQAAKLYEEVLVYQIEIDEFAAQIEELEINIKILEKKIDENKKEIIRSERTIGELEKESVVRIESNYVAFRVTGGGEITPNNILNLDGVNQLFKDTQYISTIQEDTNGMMRDLTDLQDQLDVKKQELQEKVNELNKDREAIDVKRDDLEKNKNKLDVQMASYYSEINKIQNQINGTQNTILAFNQEEIELKAEADKIQQEILNNFDPIGNGQYVAAGTYIGQQGCTGLCTGAHLHFSVQNNGAWQNPCSYLPAGGPVAGCGGSGILEEWPIRGTVYFTSGYGNRCFNWGGSVYCDFHTGIDLAGTPANAPIYAANDGWAYKGVDPYGALYVVVCQNASCQGGIKTGYWHLSSY